MVIKHITNLIPRNPSSMNLGWDLDINGFVNLPQVKAIILSHS